MQIKDYLSIRARELAKTSKRIKDFQVFDFNYIPNQPFMRQEAKPLIDAILRYATTGIANHLLVFGSRGCGKTLMVKYVSNLVGESHNLKFTYVNCRQYNTSFKILAHILRACPRGCSLDELWQRFSSAYPGKTVIVLDEIDLLSDKDRNKDILYLISRSPNNYMAVLLSNNPRFLGNLDESIKSTLQPELIHFRNYDAKEIYDILEARAKHGIARPPFKLLSQIAALTTKNTNSDVRVAIKTLYYLALNPESDVKEMFNRARRDIVQDVLADLNDRSLLILKATTSTSEPFVKTVYEGYRQLSRQLHEEPYSYVYFYSALSYLQSVGLILLLSTKIGRTYTNRIQMLFDAELLKSVWKARFG